MIRTVGVVGPGRAGQAIIRLARRTGLTVVTDAVLQADAVILAASFSAVREIATPIADWHGRLVIDTTEPPADDTTSQPDWIVPLLPGARVVRAFSAISARFLDADPVQPDGRRVLFFAGDDAPANLRFTGLAGRLGFAPVHVGSLRDGGRLLWRDGGLTGVHLLEQGWEPTHPYG